MTKLKVNNLNPDAISVRAKRRKITNHTRTPDLVRKPRPFKKDLAGQAVMKDGLLVIDTQIAEKSGKKPLAEDPYENDSLGG